jgi:hypothetical protein
MATTVSQIIKQFGGQNFNIKTTLQIIRSTDRLENKVADISTISKVVLKEYRRVEIVND